MRPESLLLYGICVAAAPSKGLPSGVYSIPMPRILNLTAYGIEFEIGNPPQKVTGLADTGSNMISFESPYDEACGRGLCKAVGTYDNKTSSTAKWIDSHYSNGVINHGYGSTVKDTIHGGEFPDFQFGQIEEHIPAAQRQLAALCGLGALCETPACDTTLTLIQQLYNIKFISRRVFSVYLGPNDANAEGALLIGGIDRAKRQGTVYKRKMVGPSDPETLHMPNRMRLHDYQIQQDDKKIDYSIPDEENSPAIWDTGIYRWRFPMDVFKAVTAYFGVEDPDPSSEQYEVDCKFREESKDGITSVFDDGAEVKVPFHILPMQLPNGKCIIDVGTYATDMGTPFLRGVYATFDYDDLTIEFAQAKYTSKTDIVRVK